MRGYPILTDDIPSRLAELEHRIARLEQPHNIDYAKRLNIVSRSTFTSKPETGYSVKTANQYSGIMLGPSLIYALEIGSGGSNCNYSVTYEQINPTPVTLTNTLASGSAVAGSSAFVVSIDTEAAGIVGTFGTVKLLLEAIGGGFASSYYTIYDAAFVGPDYEYVLS